MVGAKTTGLLNGPASGRAGLLKRPASGRDPMDGRTTPGRAAKVQAKEKHDLRVGQSGATTNQSNPARSETPETRCNIGMGRRKRDRWDKRTVASEPLATLAAAAWVIRGGGGPSEP